MNYFNMNDILASSQIILSRVQKIFVQSFDDLTNFIPTIIVALIILIAGIIAAKISKFIGKKVGKLTFNFILAFEDKINVRPINDRLRFSQTLGQIFYWLIFLYSIYLFFKILNLDKLSSLMVQLFKFMPTLFSSLGIIFLGFVFGSIIKEAIYSSSHKGKSKEPHLIAEAAKLIIIAIFSIWAIGQIGIDISIITNFLSIVIACLVGAAALGFGIGSSNHVANIIACNNIKKHYQIGEKIKVNDITGTIGNFTSTSIILETENETIAIPAKVTNDSIIVKS